jgi:hypothetical protein
MYLKLYPCLRSSDQEHKQPYQPVGSGVDPNPRSEPHISWFSPRSRIILHKTEETSNRISKKHLCIVTSTVP